MYKILVEVSYLILMYTSIATRKMPPSLALKYDVIGIWREGLGLTWTGQEMGVSPLTVLLRQQARIHATSRLCSIFRNFYI